MPQIAELWQSVTPTWTGGSIGNGILWCRVRRLNKSYQFNFYLEIGSTTSFTGGAWSFTLPASVGLAVGLPANASPAAAVPIPLQIQVSSFIYCGVGLLAGALGATATLIPYIDTSAAGGVLQSVTGTVPNSWATGDYFSILNAIEAFDN